MLEAKDTSKYKETTLPRAAAFGFVDDSLIRNHHHFRSSNFLKRFSFSKPSPNVIIIIMFNIINIRERGWFAGLWVKLNTFFVDGLNSKNIFILFYLIRLTFYCEVKKAFPDS
jgi:hypothetical protein